MSTTYDIPSYSAEFLAWIGRNWAPDAHLTTDELADLNDQYQAGRHHGPAQRPVTHGLELTETLRGMDDDDTEVINYILYSNNEVVLSFQCTARDICVFDAAGSVVHGFDRKDT